MTLRTQIESDVSNVLMEADDFAETITYCPANGGSDREIVAIVEEVGTFPNDESGIRSVEVLHVTVSRNRDDEATDGTAIGGIDDPQLGDGLRRENDPSHKFYAYSGEKSDVDDYCWMLTFTREFVVRHGGNRS